MKNTSDSNNQNILLSNGRYVHPDLLDWVRDVVTVRIPELPPLTPLTLREICGEDLWSLLDKGEQTRAGWCMVHLVARGELPMISVNECKHQSPKKYRLK